MRWNQTTTLVLILTWSKYLRILVRLCDLILREPFKKPFRSLETRDAFVTSLALLKRNALAAPFERAFTTQRELEASGGFGDLMQIHYRDEEAMYIQAAPDRVTVIFSTIFREETDRIFGKVFLQVLVLNILLSSVALIMMFFTGIC